MAPSPQAALCLCLSLCLLAPSSALRLPLGLFSRESTAAATAQLQQQQQQNGLLGDSSLSPEAARVQIQGLLAASLQHSTPMTLRRPRQFWPPLRASSPRAML